ncbi:hypothetical protein RHGRI_002393 [Rhododendron griersonianum]|uniref:Cytochrome P450 n=1 Tax=Rhododendron griersonianum TaxID=479676 RepID=A0AAV6LNV1_9ERIC|nr:hypothetical protein RHGRI_002393 [Rhododendron griersonianum]
MDYLLLLEATGMLLACLLLCYLWKSKTSMDTNAPEPKGAWPIIGHLLLLGGKAPVFRTLAAMADKHGPIFTIQIGMQRALVVSSKETIMECFTTNDRAFVSRPKSAAMKYMGYDGAISALGPHGPYWRELRKVMTHELLSNSRLELMKHMRASEVGLCINDLYSLCVKQLNGVSERLDNCYEPGRRFGFGEDEKDGEVRLFTRAMHQFMFLIGAFEYSDVIPFIEWMDLQGHVKLMKQIAKTMDYFMSRWLEEHVQSRKNALVKEERDFMDVLLSLFPEGGVEYGHNCRNIVKGTALSMILAGSDTTTAAMIWALSLLLNHKKYLKLVQQELDMHVGRERNAKAGERGSEFEFEYLPFGSGRRSCPGARAAHLMMHLTLARLLQGFDVAAPMDGTVDMSEGLGLVLPKATPLEVVVSPRLKRELYLQ